MRPVWVELSQNGTENLAAGKITASTAELSFGLGGMRQLRKRYVSKMGLTDLLSAQGVIHKLKARCKREALQAMAETAAQLVDKPVNEIMAALLEREQLGSTGVGDGVAIPHAKIEGLNAITGVFALTETPVNFDALDDQPVDLVFMLLAPENATAAHLKALAKVSRMLRNHEIRDALRGADSAESLFAIAVAGKQDHAA